MQTRAWPTLVFCLGSILLPSLSAQETDPSSFGSPPATGAVVILSEAQLDELLGPIALHPDALIALILPASTEAADLVLAARYLSGRRDPQRIDDQPWDDSVRALARYPEMVAWLDEHLEWTQRLGEAFAAQPADVMKAIQRLRARARASGALQDTPEQLVVVRDESEICIVPARPEVIYVPRYDPAVVYVRHHRPHYSRTWITFSVGCPVGAWLAYDCDWRHRRIWVVARPHRPHYWHDRSDWRRPCFPGEPGYVDHPHRQPWHRRNHHHSYPTHVGGQRWTDHGEHGQPIHVRQPPATAGFARPGEHTVGAEVNHRRPSREERRRDNPWQNHSASVSSPAVPAARPPALSTSPALEQDATTHPTRRTQVRGFGEPVRRLPSVTTAPPSPTVSAAPETDSPPLHRRSATLPGTPRVPSTIDRTPRDHLGVGQSVAPAPLPRISRPSTPPAISPPPAETAASAPPAVGASGRGQPWQPRGQASPQPGRSGRAEAQRTRDRDRDTDS